MTIESKRTDPKPVPLTTKTALAGWLGKDRTTIQKWTLRPDFPGGRDGPWLVSEIIAWIESRRQGGDQGIPTDPLLVGGNSPNLERYRGLRADLAELDVDVRRGVLVDREKMHELLARIAGVIRSAGDNLQRLYGPDAHGILDEALNDAEMEIEKAFSGDDHE